MQLLPQALLLFALNFLDAVLDALLGSQWFCLGRQWFDGKTARHR